MGGVAAFNRRVYDFTLAIPSGQTRTYGEIAKALAPPALRVRWRRRSAKIPS
jgi:O6-methylguanine-DNA--protein-cysteine methyltransferase